MALTRQEQLLRIEFDQYHRYGAAAMLLKPLLNPVGRPAQILEIGSNELNWLEAFLEPYPVMVTRADVEDHADAAAPFLHIPKDGPLPCADQSFDFVVALEVLEHIPQEDRLFHVGEWARVARKGLILSCPQNRRSVRQAEYRLDQAHRRRHGRPHPWLREHQQFGIPSKAEVRSIFHKLGLTAHVFGNAPLAEWLPLQLILEELHAQGSPELVATFNQLLNMRPFRAFAKERPYRQIYCAFRSEDQARQAAAKWHQQGVSAHHAAGQEVADFDPLLHLTKLFRELLTGQESIRPWLEAQQQAQRRQQELEAKVEELSRDLAWAQWQAGAPGFLRRWGNRLRSWGRRTGWSLTMAQPLNLVPARHAGSGVWEALNDDPQWIWDIPLARGWHRIRLWGRGPLHDQVKLYLDYGDGYSEQHMVLLGTWDQTQYLETYAYFHHPVKRARLDPMTQPGLCRVDAIAVKPVSALRAVLAGGWRGLKDRLRGKGQAVPWRSLWSARGRQECAQAWLARASQPLESGQGAGLTLPPVYAEWLERQRWSNAEREAKVSQLQGQANLPRVVFSLCVPWRVRMMDLQRTLQSLARQPQSLPCTLAITVNAALLQEVQVMLDSEKWESSRYRLLPMPPSVEGEADHLNHVLAQMEGTHLAPLSVGDQVEPDALVHVLEALTEHPEAAMIYTDEGHWSAAAGFHAPRMKPAWSPDYYRACPYIGRLAVYRRSALQAIEGFHSRWEGAHEVDAILRLAHQPGAQLVHWPKVLYHRSTNAEAPLVSPSRAAEVIQHHLAQETGGVAGEVERTREGYRVHLAIRGKPRVSIIIPTAGRLARIRGAVKAHVVHLLESVARHTRYQPIDVLLVDNGPLPAQTETDLARFALQRVRRPAPFNFSANLNLAARQAKGDQLLFLNDDMEILHDGWLEGLLRYATQPGIGAVGAKLLFPDGRIQHAGVHLFDPGPGHPYYASPGQTRGYLDCLQTPRNLLAVTGACLMTPRAVFEAVGGLDESFPLNYNDVDYCLKVHQAGWRIVYTPDVELYHFERVRRDSHENLSAWELQQFQERWAKRYPIDPYYNPNLCRRAGDYRLRETP